MNAGRLVRAFLWRDWMVETSYRGTLAVELLGVSTSIVLFYTIGKLVGNRPAALEAYGGEYFPFALIGLAVSGYFSIALVAFASRLRQAQMTGTLEIMFTMRASPTSILLCSGAWDGLLATFRLLVYLTVGLAFLGVSFHVNPLTIVLVATLSVVAFVSLGLIAASFLLVIKRGDSITLVANMMATVFGGVLFPISLLPEWVQPISYLVPLSHALEGLRRGALVSAAPQEVAGSLAALAASVLVLVPLAWIAQRWAIHHVRRSGSVSHY